MNEFCVDNKSPFLYNGLKKGDITQPWVFSYDSFDIIAQVYVIKGHNRYKKILQ